MTCAEQLLELFSAFTVCFFIFSVITTIVQNGLNLRKILIRFCETKYGRFMSSYFALNANAGVS